MRLNQCHNFQDFRLLAKKRLPSPIFNYIDGAADDEITYRRNTQSFNDIDLVPNVLAGVENIDARGHDLADVCTLLVEHVRDLMVFKSTKSPEKVLADRSPGELENLAKQADACGVAQLHRMFAMIVDMAETVTHSPFQRVSLEMGLLRILEVEPATRVQDLLERVDKLLEGGVPNAPGKPDAPSAQNPSKQAQRAPVEPVSAPVPAAESQAKPKPEPKLPQEPLKSERPESAPEPTYAEEEPPLPLPPDETPMPEPRSPKPEMTQEEADVLADEAAAKRPESAIPIPEPGCSAGICLEPEHEQMLAVWRDFVTSTLQENPFVGSILEHARLMQFEKSGVELGFSDSETFFADGARQGSNYEFMSHALAKHFGGPTKLTLSRLSKTQLTTYPSLAELKETEVKEEISAIEKQTRSDPRVRETVSILGGEIKSVVVLKSE